MKIFFDIDVFVSALIIYDQLGSYRSVICAYGVVKLN